MRPRAVLVVLGAAVAVAIAALAVARPAPTPPAGPAAPTATAAGPTADRGTCGGQSPPRAGGEPWRCTWSDEFDGTAPSPAWELIPYGLGSSCLFDDPEYVRVQDGELHLLARRLPPGHWCTAQWGLEYGGGGIQTGQGFAQRYGRFEIRARTPEGAGFWPAFWLLPADESYGGEIDVLELYGGRDDRGDVTVHVPAHGPGPTRSCALDPAPWAAFHTYRLDWSADRMAFFYDDVLCAEFTGRSEKGTAPPVFGPAFDTPYHVLLNLAVQPWWPPDGNTEFPGVLRVDYVRVWQ